MKHFKKLFIILGLFIFILHFHYSSAYAFPKIEEKYQVKVEKNVAAPMRDGVKLYADIYRADAPGKFPVILIRTPYNKEQYGNYSSFPHFAAEKGYIVIVQDVRGRYESEGEFLPYKQEINDGYDAVEWAAALPYSNGKVGTTGCSYLGAVQWQLATAAPPHLVAIFPQCTFANARHFFYFAGTFDMSWIVWLNGRLPDLKRRRSVEGKEASAEEANRQWSRNKWKWLSYLPLKEFPLFKGWWPFYYEWLAHPDDGPYWDFVNVEMKHKDVTVPAYSFTGWWDDGYGQPGAILNYLGMKKNGKTEKAQEGQKLIIGPWTHCSPDSSKAGDVDYGPEAKIDMNALVIRWLDYWLKGIDNGIMDEPPIKIFVLGDNKWRYEQEWPLARTEFTSYYLHSQDSANSLYGGGTLSKEEPAAENPDRYIYDPANPVTDYFFERPGPRDNRPVEIRNDVLVYSSEPLKKDMEVTGPIKAEIWASSSAKDTDFIVKITDVFPDGLSQTITPPLSGIMRARYRESELKPLLLTPGEIYKYTIGLMHTCYVFKAGHRIRVSLTSSYFPHVDRNPNTGHPFGEDDEFMIAQQIIYHDEKRPSKVILPIIPR
jgi:putative CocE/NonD family hydrolase